MSWPRKNRLFPAGLFVFFVNLDVYQKSYQSLDKSCCHQYGHEGEYDGECDYRTAGIAFDCHNQVDDCPEPSDNGKYQIQQEIYYFVFHQRKLDFSSTIRLKTRLSDFDS